jgi:hypothetical protein
MTKAVAIEAGTAAKERGLNKIQNFILSHNPSPL